MFSTALEANPNPIRDGHPLWIVSAALKAFLTKRMVMFWVWWSNLQGSEVKVSTEKNMVLRLTLFPSLGRSSASTLLVLGLAIWKSQKISKNLSNRGWDGQYVAEGRLLNCGNLQLEASATFLWAEFLPVQLAPNTFNTDILHVSQQIPTYTNKIHRF